MWLGQDYGKSPYLEKESVYVQLSKLENLLLSPTPNLSLCLFFIFQYPMWLGFPDWVQLKRFPLTNFVKAQLGQTFNMSFLWKSKYQSYYNYEVQHCTFDSWIVLIVQFPQGERLKIWLIPLQIIRKKLFLFKNIF